MASPVIGPMAMAAFLSLGEIGAEVGGGTDGGCWERGCRALDSGRQTGIPQDAFSNLS